LRQPVKDRNFISWTFVMNGRVSDWPWAKRGHHAETWLTSRNLWNKQRTV